MTEEKLVLFKPRSLRRAEWIIPALTLLIGPVLRELLGSRYSAYYGLAGLVFVFLFSNGLIYLWAVRQSGKWVSLSERYRLLVLEAKAASPWPIVLVTAAAIAITFLALVLILLPFDQFGSLPRTVPGVVAAASTLSGGVAWFEQRRLAHTVPDEPVPKMSLWLWLRHTLPALYLAFGISNAAAIVAELTLEGTGAGIVFTLAYVVFLPVVFQILFRSRLPQATLPALNLRDRLMLGVALFGIPMALLSASKAILVFPPKLPVRYLVETGVAAIIIALLCGLGWGASMYWARRFYSPK